MKSQQNNLKVIFNDQYQCEHNGVVGILHEVCDICNFGHQCESQSPLYSHKIMMVTSSINPEHYNTLYQSNNMTLFYAWLVYSSYSIDEQPYHFDW